MIVSETIISQDKKFRITKINYIVGVQFISFSSFEGYFILTLRTWSLCNKTCKEYQLSLLVSQLKAKGIIVSMNASLWK